MPRLIDLKGQKFGRLTVLYRDSHPQNPRYAHWVCACECGNTKSIRSASLIRNLTRSCGCLMPETTRRNRKHYIDEHFDLTGRRFGKLLVIKFSHLQKYRRFWVCRCNCGQKKTVSTSYLRSGKAISCGCTRSPDLTGQRFGRLVALRRFYSSKLTRKGAFWMCRCDCGHTFLTRSQSLRRGITTSCGCWKLERQAVAMKNRWRQKKASPEGVSL